MFSRLLVLALIALPTVVTSHAADAPQLPADWLVDPAPFKAKVSEIAATHELVIENGLARRVIRLVPNAATIDLLNVTSGEHYLRAIAPEARVRIDGTDFDVGGLHGAPIANYLDPAWFESLHADPRAYQHAGYSVEETKARFPWKKRPEWLARDLPWPPPGKHVVMRYAPPAAVPAALGGPVVLEQDFASMPLGTKLAAEWRELRDPDCARASFYNEGKVGEVASANAGTASIEHGWPAGAQSVEVLMDSGEDTSNAWGPGLALVAGGKTIRFITHPGEGAYEAAGKTGGKFNHNQPCRLRVRLSQGVAIFEAAQGSDAFVTISSVSCPGIPSAVRFGKVGMNGSGTDAGADKAMVRSHIAKVTWRGTEPAARQVTRTDLPEIEIHYELYDGIPLFSKWLVVKNNTTKTIRVNRFVAEELRIAENEMSTGKAPDHELYNLYAETDYAFGGNMNPYFDNPAVSLETDPDYPTQENYSRQTKCLLRCTPPQMGPDADIAPGAELESFRTFVLLQDSSERERRTLAKRRMYRTIAPWTAENPFMFHKTQSDPKTVRGAIDQAAEAGFEMVIMSFGSGFNFESHDPGYIATYKELAEYGKSRGIALGGYSLLASRGAATPGDNTQGQPTAFGVMPCLGATWGHEYLDTIRNMCEKTGFGVFENDGSYPGDRCAATNHPYHHGLEDSQWVQWRAITGLYQWCTANGVYLNIPDWYFLSGGTKCCMHYRESNYGLPRAEQVIVERQNMYDGTWDKCASQGWMLIPLSSYNGAEDSTIEPLDQHRDHYNERFADLIGFGVQACYRGPRLFDSDATKGIVKGWTSFYKTHREVLDGDIIHLRRANGLDWDGVLHVNPQGREKAMGFLYNPLQAAIEREIRIPLHYAGLTGKAEVSIDGGALQTVVLDPSQMATLKLRIPARGHTWVLFTK